MRVAVAMSGGVDSSTAAALLVEAGRDVIGVTMRLGRAETAGSTCCGEEEALLARCVCERLDIPHVVIDIAATFEAEVVAPFADAYAAGLTPNPCVRCNERVKLGALVERVRQLGATSLATGHYARLEHDGNSAWLVRAADRVKDQSYFLYRVSPDVLKVLEFPLGEFTKREVRKLAAERDLAAAERRDSQEVCFSTDHTALVAARHPEALMRGPVEDLSGTVLGTHHGLARYTVGQRRGLGLSGPGGPYRVVRLDARRNAVVVAPQDHTGEREVMLAEPLWRLDGPARVRAQVRYRSAAVPASATPTSLGLVVRFDEPVAYLAPGQSVVLYAGGRVVGGGFVPSPDHP